MTLIMTLTQLIDQLRTMQAQHGNLPVYLGQAAGCNLPAYTVIAEDKRVTIYPTPED